MPKAFAPEQLLIEDSIKPESGTAHESITLYDAKTIGLLDWPETQGGRYAKNFLEPLIKNGVTEYISNIHAEIYALKIDNFVFPVLLPNESKLNSYVCSPYHHYITLGKENISLFKNPFIIKTLKALLSPLDKIATLGHLDSVVYVNHWLSATDLYPSGIKKKQFSRIIHYLQMRFPNRAIIFRSLNFISTPYIEHLKTLNCHLIASRYVYLTDCCDEKIFQTRIVKSDLRLWNQKSIEYIDESQAKLEDCSDFSHLKRLLYVIQHTNLYPQHKEQYIQLLFANQLLKFKSLRRDGKCVGVAGFFAWFLLTKFINAFGPNLMQRY